MIPTAEEILRTRYKLEGNKGELRIDNLVYIMNDYAKLHVKAALEAAKFELTSKTIGLDETQYRISCERIEECYPLDNIK